MSLRRRSRLSIVRLEERNAPASFQGLGMVVNGDQSDAYSVSSNGLVAVGDARIVSGIQAFRWTAETGMISLGLLPGATASHARGCSSDGSIVVGYCDIPTGSRAFRWNATDGMVDLGVLPTGGSSFATDVSADGSVIVGYADTANGFRAFRWTDATGLTNLGALPGVANAFSLGTSVSPDGSIVVGYSKSIPETEAFRWTAATGMIGLGNPSNWNSSDGIDLSADGTVIVGVGDSLSGVEAFRWTATSGIVGLGDLPGGSFYSFANAVSVDGSIVVGISTSNFGVNQAFHWTSNGGMRKLRDVLANDFGMGNQLVGWSLQNAQACSADGKVIAGRGINPLGQSEAWIARLVPTGLFSIQINDGSPQRSRVTSITVNFDSPVNIPDPSAAFELKRQSDNQPIAMNATFAGNSVTLTFPNGPSVDFGSLADGRYTLTLKAAQINNGNFDGNLDGIGGDDYIFASDAFPNPPTNIFRLFGDSNGNGRVDSDDFAAFRNYFGIPAGPTSIFDFDNNGGTDADDFAAYRSRFGLQLP